MEKNKRLYWIDILKILACFFVIVNHTGYYYLWSKGQNLGTIGALFYTTGFAICKIAVPLFIMVTGCLLLNNKDDCKSIIKKIIRIVVPLIVLSLYAYFKEHSINLTELINFTKDFCKLPILYSYWYLYMLIGLYLVTPILQKLISVCNLKDYRYIIIICLIIPSIFPIISNYFDLEFNHMFFEGLLPISVGYYISGLYLSKIELNHRNRNTAIITFVLSITFFILSMFIPFMSNGEINQNLDNYEYIQIVLPSLSFFYLIRYYFENKKFGKISSKIIVETSLVTFGIYLLHLFVNERIYHSFVSEFIKDINPALGIVSVYIMTFILCGIITYVFRKIPIIKKFL